MSRISSKILFALSPCGNDLYMEIITCSAFSFESK